jgi:hypothetical protein
MYACLAYSYENKLLGIPKAFETEEEAWECIEQVMQQPDHPKMMWVQEGEMVGHDSDNCNPGN